MNNHQWLVMVGMLLSTDDLGDIRLENMTVNRPIGIESF